MPAGVRAALKQEDEAWLVIVEPAHEHGETRQPAGKERCVTPVVDLVKGVVLSAPDDARCVPL